MKQFYNELVALAKKHGIAHDLETIYEDMEHDPNAKSLEDTFTAKFFWKELWDKECGRS